MCVCVWNIGFGGQYVRIHGKMSLSNDNCIIIRLAMIMIVLDPELKMMQSFAW